MTKSRKVILIGIVALALTIIAFGVFFAIRSSSKNNYSRQISAAERYIELGDFESAVQAYTRAIQINPERPEGYLGLATAYTEKGMGTLAIQIAEIGLEKTGSARLELLVNDIQNEYVRENAINVSDNIESNDYYLKELSGEGINTSLLYSLGSTTYNDYRLRNGIEETDTLDTEGTAVRVSGVHAKMVYGNSATDANGNPLAESVPSAIYMDNIAEIFNGQQSVSMTDIKLYGAENVGILNDPEHGYELTFTMSGCVVVVESDAEGRIEGGAWNKIIPLSVTEEGADQGSCSVSGKILNAVNKNAVNNAELRIRTGSQTFGPVIQTVHSDLSGKYNINLDSGDYMVEVVCTGYTTEFFKLYVGSNREMTAEPFYLSPMLSNGQIRIVLEWGNSPTDLDSHLDGSLDSGFGVHVDFTNKYTSKDGNKIAELDIDDTDGYGPETTTIYDTNGKFVFSVEDYTGSGTMSLSGATVKIYLPDQSAPIEVHVPSSGIVNYWNVCTIDHGEVTVNNHG